MASNTPKVIGGVAIGVLILILLPLPTWLTWLAVAAVIGLPVVGYLTLDPSQRRRLRERRNRQIGR